VNFLKALFFFISLLTVLPVTANDVNSPDHLYIKKSDLDKKEGVKLDSNWDFYWEQLLRPDQIDQGKLFGKVDLTNWTHFANPNNEKLPSLGYATYRLRFTVPKENPNLSLYVPRIIGAYKLWVNGKLAMEVGKVGTSRETTLHRRFIKVIPLNSLESDFEIVIQVSNFYNKKGGIDEPILLGNTRDMIAKQSLQSRVDMVFIGSLSFIGVFFLVFFFVFWSKDRAVFYFALFCLGMAYHALNDNYAPLAQLFDNLSWVLTTKTEYLSAHLLGVGGSYFFAEILSKFVHKWYKKSILISILSFSFLTIILPAPLFTELVVPYLILLFVNIIYVLLISIYAIKSGIPISNLLIVCLLFAVVIFTGQIFSYIYDSQNTLIYVKFGGIILFLSISFLLMQRFSASFKELEISNKLVLDQKEELLSINQSLSESVSELENSNKELDDFNHIVSHDLKSPLSSIYSIAHILEVELQGKLDETTQNFVGLLKTSVDKMNDSINGLLDYSKATRQEKKYSHINFNDLLNELVNYLDLGKNTEVILPKENLNIYANKIELEHVFQNLISNSVKYNDKEKTIIEISASQDQDKNLYVFSVKDNGPGIPEKHHSKMFQIFKQAKISSKSKDSTGIGLAIVKRIIDKNFGKISVESKENEGLTIRFSWRMKTPSEVS
jgi:signal transduction histidine kinase